MYNVEICSNYNNATLCLTECGKRIASFPVPHPAIRHLQYGKAERAWYIFSRDRTKMLLYMYVLRVIQPIRRSVSMTVAPR